MKKYISLFSVLLAGVLYVNAQCKILNSLSETFNTWKSIDECWDSKSGLAMIYPKNNRITFYSLFSPGEEMYLMTPKIKAGNYTLSLDISKNGGNSIFEIFAAQDKSDEKSFVPISKKTKIIGTKNSQNFILKKDAHLVFKVLLTDIHQAVYMDNVFIKLR